MHPSRGTEGDQRIATHIESRGLAQALLVPARSAAAAWLAARRPASSPLPEQKITHQPHEGDGATELFDVLRQWLG
jgi:hypothetical protein